MAQEVKNLSAMWETWVQSLGPEDLVENGMATHSNILPWKIPWTEEPGSPWYKIIISTCMWRAMLHIEMEAQVIVFYQ